MAEHFNITKEDLKEVVAAAIMAAKAPTPLEEEELQRRKREIEAKQAERETNAAGVLSDIAAKRAIRMACTHEHADGHTHAVFVYEKSGPGYFICQKNQCKIRPEVPVEERLDHEAIYDTKEYNRLVQKVASNDIFG